MDWFKKGQLSDLEKLDYRLTKLVQDIRQSHKLHHGSHEKLESIIDHKRKKCSRGKCPEKYPPGICNFTITISNSDKATQLSTYPVSWGCRIHWLHLCRGVRPPLTSILDRTLNNLMVRFQQCWSFGEWGVPLHCHRSQIHSGPEW